MSFLQHCLLFFLCLNWWISFLQHCLFFFFFFYVWIDGCNFYNTVFCFFYVWIDGCNFYNTVFCFFNVWIDGYNFCFHVSWVWLKPFECLERVSETLSTQGCQLGVAVRLVSRRTLAQFHFSSLLSSKDVVCGHCLATMTLTVNDRLKRLSSLTVIMQESLLWWQCSNRYSLLPPPPSWLVPLRRQLHVKQIQPPSLSTVFFCTMGSSSAVSSRCPQWEAGMSDVFLLSGISGLSFYSPFLSLVVLQWPCVVDGTF